jgi:hypothetical protein
MASAATVISDGTLANALRIFIKQSCRTMALLTALLAPEGGELVRLLGLPDKDRFEPIDLHSADTAQCGEGR